ncbi:hypothetical protein DDB_G0290615 [Dictyostelium discoideum AX4]|uniref:Uncharacterized protein n=1 Tax=Dictyostelium discoideum TaxID=44689 RepID=Q54FS3_DICDI|nr:hypothetical protein DDB_G0290615 [Dictyostelium discoideum AX4]EAL62168.1 hypothetical protein DDB_G0290615 [Dictyostelium discoideum AX4]|eukprot:XP_635694.1 hypothetical protein DDB_G0290615 [Dictyostelium discoideum AX4]
MLPYKVGVVILKKSELIKNLNLIADDIITNLNLNFQQKRTKTAIKKN